MSRIIKAYHGSPNKIDKWSYEKIGKNATMEGFGFYFTSSYKVALGYSEGGYVYHVDLDFKQPFILGKRKLSIETIEEMLRVVDPKGDGFLSNYGDVDYEGYESVLSTSASELDNYNDDDVDIINEIFKSSEYDVKEFYTIIRDKFGYDSIVAKDPSWGGDQIIYVAWFNDQIKVTKIEEVPKEGTTMDEIKKIIKEEIEDFYTDMEQSLKDMKDRAMEKSKFLKRVKDVVPSDQAEEKRAKKAQFDQSEEDLEQIDQMEKDLETQKSDQEKLANMPQDGVQTNVQSLTNTQSFTSN